LYSNLIAKRLEKSSSPVPSGGGRVRVFEGLGRVLCPFVQPCIWEGGVMFGDGGFRTEMRVRGVMRFTQWGSIPRQFLFFVSFDLSMALKKKRAGDTR